MLRYTKENDITSKLEYIGLDLAKIPSFLMKKNTFEYKPRKVIEENYYKVYKYIPASKIEILLTPCNRLNTIQEKCIKASSVSDYLDSQSEKNILKHTTFLKMLSQVEISKIEEIEQEQKKLQTREPFLVKYQRNYLWQIYYSDITDTYFMLVPTEDLEYSAFFYLLKKQIEIKRSKKEEYLYVPISYEDYSNSYLKKSQLEDLEKYMFQLTRNWITTYEVYDKDGNMNLHITGKTAVYEKIESEYKVILTTREDTEKFYNLIKALFILVTELPQYYAFQPQITENGMLEFEYHNQKVTYDKLMEVFIKEYENARKEIQRLQREQETLKENFENSKQEAYKKEQEYLAKERLIATYLECRKTFLGKVKYFFKLKKSKKNQNTTNKEVLKVKKEDKEAKHNETIKLPKKEYYTIQDILQIYQILDEKIQMIKNLALDIKAQQQKIKSLTKKIENASLYLTEIDKHEKSIFEFWKFASKDEQALLQAPKEENEKTSKREKVFDYEEDYEEIATFIDKQQRNKLTKEQTDALFIATTELMPLLKNGTQEDFAQALQKLKEEAKKERILFNQENFDLFGNVSQDNTKIQVLAGKKHREARKDKFKILDITSNLRVQEFKEEIVSISKQIEETVLTIFSPVSLWLYCTQEEPKEDMQIFYIKPDEAIKQEKNKQEINLYRINLKKQMPVVYFTNNIYYDNDNKTLPLGMHVTSQCLVNLKNYEIVLKQKQDFRILTVEEEVEAITTKVIVYEYEINERKDSKT